MQEVLMARKLRLAIVTSLWREGSLSKTEAKELLSGPLTLGDDSTIYDDARYLNDLDGLTRDAQLRNEAVEVGQTCPSCGGHGRLRGEIRAYECPNCNGTGQV